MIYLIPVFIALIGIVLNNPSDEKGKKQQTALFVCLCIINILIFGLRYRVGIDTLNYMLMFDHMTEFDADYLKDTSVAPFFILLMSICKTICSDFTFFQFVHSTILNVIVFRYLYKNTINPFAAYIIFFIAVGPYFNTEILKESLAICCFLLGYPFLEKYREYPKLAYLYYYAFILIAIGFHYGAVVLMLIPFLRYLKFNYTLLFIAIFFFIAVQSVYDFALNILPTEALQKRLAGYNDMMERESLNLNYVIMAFLKFTFLPFITLLFGRGPFQKNERNVPMVCSLLIIGLGCIRFQVLFQRVSNYFMMFFVCYLSNLLYIKKKNIIHSFGIFGLFFVVFTYGIFFGNQGVIWYPYHSIFDPIKEPLRELMWSPYNLK